MRSKTSEILFITSYPPRECGIATYSQDLIKAINNKFGDSLSIKICALEADNIHYIYSTEVKYTLDTSLPSEYEKLALNINQDNDIKIILIQHEFGFFKEQEQAFLEFLYKLSKPIIFVFHTILPSPNEHFKMLVKKLINVAKYVIVMTNTSKGVLNQDYEIPQEKIQIIPHGTHLVLNNNKEFLKEKYGLKGHKILSTFGLLNSGKSIETTLDALPAIIKINPETLFLIIGKTHPNIIKSEGEKYRQMLEEKVLSLKLEKHVKFINKYLELAILLEHLRLSDIYLFTSKDPNQAVSGTFSYAMSCGCAVISTPIPQAREMLDENTGIIIEFEHSEQLATGVIKLLNNDLLRRNISTNTLHKIAATAWENSAIAHALLFEKILNSELSLEYKLSDINLNHIKELTTDFGMLQFSKINQADINSGYTIDDNARALIAMCIHYELTQKKQIWIL